MAKGKKTGGKPFEKGHKIGRPRLSKEQKALSRLTRTQIQVMCDSYMQMSIPELKQIIKDAEKFNSTLPTIHSYIVAIILEGVLKRDQVKLGFLMDHMLGRLPVTQDLISSDGSMSPQPTMHFFMPKNGRNGR